MENMFEPDGRPKINNAEKLASVEEIISESDKQGLPDKAKHSKAIDIDLTREGPHFSAPIRRANSSPEMTASWKLKFLENKRENMEKIEKGKEEPPECDGEKRRSR